MENEDMDVRESLRARFRRSAVQSVLLGKTLLTRLPEAVDQVQKRIESAFNRQGATEPVHGVGLDEAIERLGGALGVAMNELDTGGLGEIEEAVRGKVGELEATAPFSMDHNADLAMARLCYLIVRAVRPEVLVETGVAFGVTTAFVLKAMSENGAGVLHSIDLPPLRPQADRYIGILVPEELRSRWHLHKGSSRRLLPKVLRQVSAVDFFIHDSAHTYSNMTRELEWVTRSLSRRGVVVADDVNCNSAFSEWLERSHPADVVVVAQRSKRNVFGVALFGRVQS